MMKLKYSICCGLDVHKNVIVATIVTTNKDGISEYLQKSFSTINSDIQRFHNWLIENNCYHVCMESTGKYWIPIFNYLENDIDICLTHPKYVKAIKGKKTDKKDSKWIADLYKFDLVRCSFIPPKDFRQLRELARYRFKLVCMKSSEKNRIQNCMTISNVGIASVLSDPFGKTATEIMSYLLEHTADSMDEKAVRKLIKKGAKAKSDEIIEAIKGYNIETDQAKKLELAQGHLEYLDDMITQTEVELYVRIKPYYEFVDLPHGRTPSPTPDSYSGYDRQRCPWIRSYFSYSYPDGSSSYPYRPVGNYWLRQPSKTHLPSYHPPRYSSDISK